ncbi:MAG TPA: hypothetical protein VNS32_15775, partial [Flavisolibacter sp.]|nr:hypothetical protein [Flavisolibacter sp.]
MEYEKHFVVKFKANIMLVKLNCAYTLDMEAVMKSNPFKEGEKLKRDHLLFIIHCILQQRAGKDDEHLSSIGKRDGFVPLHSRVLESKIPNYRACIEYLIKAGVIECDESYSCGNVSKGYRLT